MSPSSVDWLPGLIALAAGLLAGAVLVFRFIHRSGPAATSRAPGGGPGLELRDLAARRDVLLAQLREMEDTAAKRSPEQLARERYALELEAANVLRRLDAAEPVSTPRLASVQSTPLAAPPAARSRPALVGFLWGTGTAVALGLLLFFVSQAASPRTEGGTATGNTPMDGRTAAPSATADAEEAQIRAALERNPDDLEARLELARYHLGKRDMMGVWNETQYVLTKAPGDPRALSYQSLVRLAMGQSDLALKMVQEAVAKAPDLLEAYVHMTLIYVRIGKVKEAEATIADASRRFPDQAPMLGRLLEEMRTSGAETEPSPADHADPHAGVPPPAESTSGPSRPAAGPPGGAPPPPAAEGEAGRKVAGTVDIDPALRAQVPAGALVFVTVREAGFGAGPPMAAKRLPASFPLRFEIGISDSMMGQPLPAEMLIEARLDADGDPMSRSKADPSDRRDDVKAGTTDLNLVLRKPSGS